MVPNCLIVKPPYAERTASFFSSASGLSQTISRKYNIQILICCLLRHTMEGSILCETIYLYKTLIAVEMISSSSEA